MLRSYLVVTATGSEGRTELGIGQPAGVTHVFYEPAIPAEADFKTTEFSFSGHKTTEQIQVLSESDVHSVQLKALHLLED